MEENIRERKKSISNRELIVTASEGNFEQVKHLIEEARAEVNFVDRSGRTALHYAVEKGSGKVVDYLLEKGADINIEDNNNRNPLDIAVSNKKVNITRMLGRKIVDKSIGVIEKFHSPIKVHSFYPEEPGTSSNEGLCYEKQKKIIKNNIKVLSKRLGALTLKYKELSDEQAHVFILFLKTFEFETFSKEKVKDYLEEHFLKDDETARKIVENTRNLISNLENKDRELSDVKQVIRQCYVNEFTGQSKVQLFFLKLKEYVKIKAHKSNVSRDDRKYSSFLEASETLTIKHQELSHQQVNVFILFLETFAFKIVSREEVKEYLEEHFLQYDETGKKIEEDTDNLILPSQNRDKELSRVKQVIKQCYVNETSEVTGQSKVQHFFYKLQEYVENEAKISNVSQGDREKVSSFLETSKALTLRHKDLSNEQVNVFVLFLETFEFETVSNEEVKEYLEKHFLQYDETGRKIEEDTNNVIKSQNRKKELSCVKQVIRQCYVNEITGQSKIQRFFHKLKEYVAQKNDVPQGDTKKLSSFLEASETLTLKHQELSYEQANVFILFLETFSFQNDSNKEGKKYLEEYFLKDDKSVRKIMENTRSLILKANDKDREFYDVTKVIEQCYVNETSKTSGQSKVQLFFHELKEYVTNKTSKLSSFFQQFPSGFAREQLGKPRDATDVFDKLKGFVLEVYRKSINLEQQWFHFIINVYPTLDIPDRDKKVSDVEQQIRHIRNNVIHAFHLFGIPEFREVIINIRGKLIEFYYAKRVHNLFMLLTPGGDINVEDNCLACLKTLQCNFEYSGEISSEEAKSLFGFKFVRSLFAKQSSNTDNSAVKSVVEQYFKYMSLIEDENRVSPYDDDSAETENSASDKELSDVARREVFEKFVRLSRIKENCSDEIYTEEKEKLFIDLQQYSVEETKFNSVCKYFLKEGNHFNEDVSEVIENVVKFIEGIRQIKESDSDYKEKEIVSLGELILNKDNADRKLDLSERRNLYMLKKKAEKDRKTMQLFDRADSFKDICIQIDNICLNINVIQAIKNMLKTFYNAYNEYRIVFDIEDIFSRGTFLNELVWQNEKEKITDLQVFIIVYKLIDIEYMSPYIVKLIESKINKGSETSKIIDNKNLAKLIDNLLIKDEYVEYLDILLKKIEVNSSFNPYEIVFNEMLVKKADLKRLSSIFKEFKHLEQFTSLVTAYSPKDYDNKQKINIFLKFTKSFLRIINEEAADHLYYTANFDKALKILEKGKEIQVTLENAIEQLILKNYTEFQEIFENALEDSYPDFIDRELLIVRIKNRQGKYQEAFDILDKEKRKLKSDTSISHKAKYLLILSDIVYTNKLLKKYTKDSYSGLYSDVLKYIFDLDGVSENFDDIQNVKKKYNKIEASNIYLGRYKRLLSSSELLHSEKYLDILRIALDSAYQMIKLNDDATDDNSGEKREESYNDALKIREEIYACYKKYFGVDNRRTIQIVRYIANTHSKLGDIYKARKKASDALFHYLRALNKYERVYRVQEKVLGSNHYAVIDGRRSIAWVMRNIAFSFNNLGDSSKNLSEHEKAVQNYNEALTIYEKVNAYQRKHRGKEHERTLRTWADIAHTHNKLAMAKKLDSTVLPPHILNHHTKALKIYGKLKEKRWDNAEKMKFEYERTKKWKDQYDRFVITFGYGSSQNVVGYATRSASAERSPGPWGQD